MKYVISIIMASIWCNLCTGSDAIDLSAAKISVVMPNARIATGIARNLVQHSGPPHLIKIAELRLPILAGMGLRQLTEFDAEITNTANGDVYKATRVRFSGGSSSLDRRQGLIFIRNAVFSIKSLDKQ